MSAPFGRLTSDAPRTAHEAPASRAREAQIIVALLGGDAIRRRQTESLV